MTATANLSALLDELDIPEFMGRGLCAQADPEEFFPEKGASTSQAKRVCASCPVRAECLEYALDRGERYGIWGGTSERQRRALLAERRAIEEGAAA